MKPSRAESILSMRATTPWRDEKDPVTFQVWANIADGRRWFQVLWPAFKRCTTASGNSRSRLCSNRHLGRGAWYFHEPRVGQGYQAIQPILDALARKQTHLHQENGEVYQAGDLFRQP